jgi:hypothetical protein
MLSISVVIVVAVAQVNRRSGAGEVFAVPNLARSRRSNAIRAHVHSSRACQAKVCVFGNQKQKVLLLFFLRGFGAWCLRKQ